MTDTITLSSEVAKRILRNIEIGNALSAGIEMRREVEAALEQPQDHRKQHLNMVPAGWKLVPVEPTKDMKIAGAYAAMNQVRMSYTPPRAYIPVDSMALLSYRAMLAAAPQPPAVEQPQAVTDCHQSQPQGEQEPVAYYVMNGAALFQLFRSKSQADALAYDLQKRHDLSGSLAHFHVVPLYTHPQNLNCKSNQARLATLWGYEKPQPPRQPLTDAQINDHRLALPYDGEDLPDPWDFKQGVKAAERAHGIGGEA